ncbi:MAG TPA: 1-acyl-sn-glycerol-3-phosphate acyltransferase, partial [Spirochaetia bacterium]
MRTGLKFLPPAKNPWLLRFSRAGSWLYVRFGNRITREDGVNMERLVRAVHEMQDGRTRLIVAFRHPGVEDGTIAFRLLCGIAAREARRLGTPLRRPPR